MGIPILFLLMSRDPTVQLIIYVVKNGNLEGLSWVTKWGCPWVLLKLYEEESFIALNPFQEHKGWEEFLFYYFRWFLFFFSVVAGSQSSVHLYCTARWPSHTYTYTFLELLNLCSFLRAQGSGKIDIVSHNNYRGKQAVCLKSDCPGNTQFERISFSVWK